MAQAFQSFFRGAGLPAFLFVALAAAPFVYRAAPVGQPVRLVKLAVLTAFSGPLQGRGNDEYIAVTMAIHDAAPSPPGRIMTVLTALDDRGRPETAMDQARGAAADPGVAAVLCCTTLAAQQAVAGAFSSGRPGFYPLAAEAPPGAEAALAVRRFGAGPVALVSDNTNGAGRGAALGRALQAAGDPVSPVSFAPTAGGSPEQVASAVAALKPRIIVLDANYPAAAALAPAIRAAGVAAPLLGDDRLDGSPAAALLSGTPDLYYVAPDRDALMRQVGAPFAAAFLQARGHAPSVRDAIAYQETRAALTARRAPDWAAIPVTLYAMVPGAYPGQALASAGAPA